MFNTPGRTVGRGCLTEGDTGGRGKSVEDTQLFNFLRPLATVVVGGGLSGGRAIRSLALLFQEQGWRAN